MKGIIFTEFLDMVDKQMSPEMVEHIISQVHFPSGCAYSAVGTYDYQEILELITKLSESTGVSIPELQKTYGRHLFGMFTEKYPTMFHDDDSAFDVLERVDNTIHRQVHKLYPDAELPTFKVERHGETWMKLDYTSTKPFADLAEGLILGCIEHFSEHIELLRVDLSPAPYTHSIFVLKAIENTS